jgi:ABC-type branched-subunit amino acid transport system substrate-binding protein
MVRLRTSLAGRRGRGPILFAISVALVACSACGSSNTSTTTASPETGTNAGSSQATLSPYTIYSINDNGSLQPEQEMIADANAAVAEVNATGGIHGHRLVIDFCSGNLDLNTTLACARKAASTQSVLATAGDFFANGNGASTILASAGLSQFGVWGTTPSDYQCHSCYLPSGGSIAVNIAQATLLADDLKATKIAAVPIDVPAAHSSTPLVNGILASSGRKTRIVKTIYAPPTQTDFSSIVADVDNAGVQGVFLGMPQPMMLGYLHAAGAVASPVPIVAAQSSLSPSDLKGLSPAAKAHLYMVSLFNPASSASSKIDAASTTAHAFVGNNLGTTAWLGVMMFAEVARSVSDVSRQSIAAAAKSFQFNTFGLTPPLDFSKRFTGLGGQFPGLINPYAYYQHADGNTLVLDNQGKPVNIFVAP